MHQDLCFESGRACHLWGRPRMSSKMSWCQDHPACSLLSSTQLAAVSRWASACEGS